MGASFSAFSKFGLPGLSSATTGQVYERHFKNKNTGTFEEFHIAYVEFCKYFNTVMPGQDFDTPSREEIKKFHDKWMGLPDDEKKDAFFDFIEKNVKEAKVDDRLFIMAGIAAPAAAVIGKRASGHIPYVKSLKLEYVPNVVFVPLFTLLAIIGASAAQMNRKSAAAVKAEEGSAAAVKAEEGSAAAAKAEKSATEQNKKDKTKAT